MNIPKICKDCYASESCHSIEINYNDAKKCQEIKEKHDAWRKKILKAIFGGTDEST